MLDTRTRKSPHLACNLHPRKHHTRPRHTISSSPPPLDQAKESFAGTDAADSIPPFCFCIDDLLDWAQENYVQILSTLPVRRFPVNAGVQTVKTAFSSPVNFGFPSLLSALLLVP